jgi:hypothetical protein
MVIASPTKKPLYNHISPEPELRKMLATRSVEEVVP